MTPKQNKMTDVKHPADVTPATSSRPIVVTNRPILTADPMMAPSPSAGAMSEQPAVPMARTARTITPPSSAPVVEPGAPGVQPASAVSSVLIPPVRSDTSDADADAAVDANAGATEAAEVTDTAQATDITAPATAPVLSSTKAVAEAGVESKPTASGPVIEITMPSHKRSGFVAPLGSTSAPEPSDTTVVKSNDESKSEGVAELKSTTESEGLSSPAKDAVEPAGDPVRDTQPASALVPPTLQAASAPATESTSPTDSQDTGDEATKTPEAPEDINPVEAETRAADAKAAREVELEGLISSGKYRIPINASRRRRSHMRAVLWSLCAVVLAVALANVLLDMGIVDPPMDIPSTHFFTND